MGERFSVFFHNYYGDHAYWMNFFTKNTAIPFNLYYNIVADSIYNTETPASDFFYDYSDASASTVIRNLVVRQSSNKGKDIGGKLVLLDAYQRLGDTTEYGMFLHDKRSPYKANSETWASNLFKIAEPAFSKRALQLFSVEPGIGIITASGNVRNEYSDTSKSFISTNKLLLPGLQEEFGVSPPLFNYVPGTMFWFRMQPVKLFFQKHPPLEIRKTLESGNVTDELKGSHTHSWERMLCWIISSQGYQIKTI